MRILIFATTYVDTPARVTLTQQWVDLHRNKNPDCDLRIIDSCSPAFWSNGVPSAGWPRGGTAIWSFPDNIGHLSRGGRDGWGRAFCKGIEQAIDEGFDYVAHIEGDSLFRVPVRQIAEQMRELGQNVVSVPVEGTRRKEIGWVETGLMIFRTDYLVASDFIARYDWPNRTERPTPEKVIFDLLGTDLTMLPLRAQRGDKSQITPANVEALDWVTHTTPDVYAAFMAAQGLAPAAAAIAPGAAVKINLGCGLNRMPGWANYDAEIDIAKKLPFADAHADFMFAEHVVEHVTQYQALDFFRECRRVLKPGGVLRIALPAIDRIYREAAQPYFDFARRWAPSADRRGAMHAMTYAHGHKALWTRDLLKAALYLAGFERLGSFAPGESCHAELAGVEGHGRVIGAAFNHLETVVVEAS